jgi:hypothetical protein
MNSPDDISGVVELIETDRCRAQDVVCIVGKTEGNGCVNDFTRGFSTFVLPDGNRRFRQVIGSDEPFWRRFQ